MDIDDVLAKISGGKEVDDIPSPKIKPVRTRTNPNRELLKNAPYIETELLEGIYDAVSSSAENINDIAILLNTTHEMIRGNGLDLQSAIAYNTSTIDGTLRKILAMLSYIRTDAITTDLQEQENKNEAERTKVVSPGQMLIPPKSDKKELTPESSGGFDVLGLLFNPKLILAALGAAIVGGVGYLGYKIFGDDYFKLIKEGWEVVVDATKAVFSTITSLAVAFTELPFMKTLREWTEKLVDDVRPGTVGSLALKVADATGIAKLTDKVMGIKDQSKEKYMPYKAGTTTREQQEAHNKRNNMKPGMQGYIDPNQFPTAEQRRAGVTTVNNTTTVSPSPSAAVNSPTVSPSASNAKPTLEPSVNATRFHGANSENKENSTVTVTTVVDNSVRSNVAAPTGNGGEGAMPPTIPMRSARNATPVMRYLEFESLPAYI